MEKGGEVPEEIAKFVEDHLIDSSTDGDQLVSEELVEGGDGRFRNRFVVRDAGTGRTTEVYNPVKVEKLLNLQELEDKENAPDIPEAPSYD